MSKTTVTIKAKDPNGYKAEVVVRLDSGTNLTRGEVKRLKREVANSFAATLRGTPYTDFSVLDMRIT